MSNKMKLSLGVLALVLAIGLNVRHALNDYGVKDNKLHVEVLAQTTTTTGGGSSGSTGNSSGGGGTTSSSGSGSGTSSGGSKNCKQGNTPADQMTKCDSGYYTVVLELTGSVRRELGTFVKQVLSVLPVIAVHRQ